MFFTNWHQQYKEPVLAHAFNLWVDIQAPIDLVFEFISQEKRLQSWWCTHATSDCRPGGALTFNWDGAHSISGEARFRQFEPPQYLIWEWTKANGASILCDGEDQRGMLWPALNIFYLFPIGPQNTRLHIHDYGINAGHEFQEIRQASGKGWLQAGALLKKAVEAEMQRRDMDRTKREMARRTRQKALEQHGQG